jgi:hypothetical protein
LKGVHAEKKGNHTIINDLRVSVHTFLIRWLMSRIEMEDR